VARFTTKITSVKRLHGAIVNHGGIQISEEEAHAIARGDKRVRSICVIIASHTRGQDELRGQLQIFTGEALAEQLTTALAEAERTNSVCAYFCDAEIHPLTCTLTGKELLRL
jgi:hypothetical protein